MFKKDLQKSEVFWTGPRHDNSMITHPLHLSDVKLKLNYNTFLRIPHHQNQVWWSSRGGCHHTNSSPFRANVRLSLQMLKNLNWKDDLKFCQLHQFHPSIAFHHHGAWKACHGDQNEWRMSGEFNCSFLAELLYSGRQLEDGYINIRLVPSQPARHLICFKEKKSFVE